VWIGAESGSQKILDAMDKGDTAEDIYNAARLLREKGMEVGFFLQFGYPGETWEDVQKTLKMVRECAPDDIGISVSYPLPGTKFYERVKLELGEKQNWVDSEDLAMLYRGPFPTEFYRILHGRVHYEFRARKALRQPSLRGWINIPRNLIGLIRSEIQLRNFV
jgi:anaerobic magnesium-protoporphyrin IX monomethyl ester cyclase